MAVASLALVDGHLAGVLEFQFGLIARIVECVVALLPRGVHRVEKLLAERALRFNSFWPSFRDLWDSRLRVLVVDGGTIDG